MKIATKILILLTIVFAQACKDLNKDCDECFTPPGPFRFELVDKTTGVNLFQNGTFKSSEIKIVNLANNNNVEFIFIAENNIDLIQVNTIGWQTEKINYAIKTGTKDILNLYVDAQRLNENCCSFTKYNEIKIENSEFELNSTTGIYKVFVE